MNLLHSDPVSRILLDEVLKDSTQVGMENYTFGEDLCSRVYVCFRAGFHEDGQ